MAKSTQDTVSGNGLLKSLRASPVTQLLTDQAVRLIDAQTDKLTGKVNNGVNALSNMSESGQLPALGKGAGKLLETGKPVSAALTTAKSAVTEKAKNVIGIGKGKGKGKGTGQAKAMNIEESIDVGVPVSVAYNQWTQFKDFSRFMKGVESVEQTSDTEMNWRGKVFKSRRTWKATIQEQVPDERIVWTSEGAKGSTKGVVTFHPLGENLTRVLLALEYYPQGVVEKTGNIWRSAGRRTRLDLKNYRRFVMLEGKETGSWRGHVEDGKVVQDSEDSERKGRRPRKAAAEKSEGRPRKATAAARQGRSTSQARTRKSSEDSGSTRSRSQSASGRSPRKQTSSTARKASARKAQPAKRTTTRRRSAS
jgi:uncharacterized membrane protein